MTVKEFAVKYHIPVDTVYGASAGVKYYQSINPSSGRGIRYEYDEDALMVAVRKRVSEKRQKFMAKVQELDRQLHWMQTIHGVEFAEDGGE